MTATPSPEARGARRYTKHPSRDQLTLGNCFSPALNRDRNAIERMLGRIKNFRRIATRYDRLEQNVLTAVGLVANIYYRLRI